jgi:predicted nucleotidyltransferase
LSGLIRSKGLSRGSNSPGQLMFESLLQKISHELDRLHIAYMLIGGQAVLLYGEPRLTRDVDITLGVGPDRLPEILGIAQAANWRVLVESPERFVAQTMVLPCLEPTSNIRIDFIFSVSAYEQEALTRARRVGIGSAEVCFASIEDLIVHKIVAGRPRDLEDLKGILLKKPVLDVKYIRYWLGEFDQTLGRQFVQQFDGMHR